MYNGYYLQELTVRLQGAKRLKQICRVFEIPRHFGVGPHHLNIRK